MCIPNKYTGYLFLLDKENRVRWRGSGRAEESDLNLLFRGIDELLVETKLQRPLSPRGKVRGKGNNGAIASPLSV